MPSQNPNHVAVPRIVVAALKGGAGKTFLTIGLIAALRRRGLSVSAFKKGPDYIDAGWLGLAANRDCHNLDAYLFDTEVVKASFGTRAAGTDVAVVEGNRGLFDGTDSKGSYSTAELAKLLKAPVVLIVDATKMTRTAAALVKGCRALDPQLDLKAVILNRVGGPRHQRVVTQAIEEATSVPVIGSVGKLPMKAFPQRHLGLLPLQEHPDARKFVDEAAEVANVCIDLDSVLKAAQSASAPIEYHGDRLGLLTGAPERNRVRIGVMRDSAFQFYYPENLEALRHQGADLVIVNALESEPLPTLDALYIGGGFPETHAEQLAGNAVLKESLRDAVDQGLPVYAECGGLMYLSKNLRVDEKIYPMAGIFPVDTVLKRKPQGHGYVKIQVSGSNPFYPQGVVLTGHEFHYSHIYDVDKIRDSCAFTVLRGHGIDGSRDGMCTRNVLATYVHLHGLGEPLWVQGLVTRAREYKTRRA